MWYSGSAHTTFMLSPGGICLSAGLFHTAHCSTFATRLRWSSIAPLLTPVVPPVYCSTARSSGPIAGGASCLRAPSATASLKRTAAGSEKCGTSLRT
jgi:hypothetical protein